MSDFTPSKASQQSVQDSSRLMDRTWENIQKKTFTNWLNNQLAKKEVSPVASLDTDLSSGEKLIQLLEIIGDESLGKYNKNPKLRIQKMENATKALDFIRKRGVQLTNIGAEDIVDSNLKLILGLLWTIILRFSIAEISEEGLSAKEGLLLWCQKRTQPYVDKDPVPLSFIKDFTFAWQDGLAFCALIHRHRPDVLDYWTLDKKNKHENTQLAFDIAEQHLGIPKLFGVEDIVDVVKPDERSVMTYVAQYFHAFSALDKFGTAARRVGQFANVMQQTWEMQNDYEKRVGALIQQLSNMQSAWAKSSVSGYADAIRQLRDFESYKSTLKRTWIAERRDLDTLLGNIQTKLKTYNLKPYFPPSGSTLEDLAHSWDQLVQTEGNRKRNLTASLREIKDTLRRKYADSANQFVDQLSQISNSIITLEGTLEHQLNTTNQLIQQCDLLKNELVKIEGLSGELVAANIEDNEYTIYSFEDLSFDFDLLSQSLSKKVTFIENQMVARSMTNLTAELLEEYSETFRSCDKRNVNHLNLDEFKLALAAEGSDLPENEIEKIFNQLINGSSEGITFEQFIDYMKSEQEDRVTVDQLQVAFQTLAVNKPYVTEQDLYRVGISPEYVEYLKTVMPRKEDGLDFSQYVLNVFE